MSAGPRERRDDMSTAFFGAVILHAVVGAALIVFAPPADTKVVINSVPVNVVSTMPDSAPDVGVPIPLPAEPAPVDLPTPTPPPPPPPAPKPPAKSTPAPRAAPTGTQPARRPPAPPKSLSGDDLLADLSSDPTLTERRPPSKSTSRPPPQPNTKVGSQNRGQLSAAARANAMSVIAEQAADHWRLDCAAPTLARIRPKLRFRLNSSGRLVGEPQIVGGESDPSWQAAARGAVTAMKNAQPFRDVPAELIGPELNLNFNAANACRGR